MSAIPDILTSMYAGRTVTIEFLSKADAEQFRQRLAILKSRQEKPYQKLGMEVTKLVLRQQLVSKDVETGSLTVSFYLQSEEAYKQERKQASNKLQYTVLSVEEA